MGRTAAGWPLNLNEFDQIEGIRDAVLEKFGRVDILAAVAGIRVAVGCSTRPRRRTGTR